MAVLLDQRRVDFDAIVVSNDQMALGVLDAFRARGVRVPRDIAIIGFDFNPQQSTALVFGLYGITLLAVGFSMRAARRQLP